MYKPTIIGLLIVLVLIIVYQFYKISEGFSSGSRIVATTQRNGEFIDIIANTVDGSTLRGIKILYNSGIPVLPPGQSTDTSLALNLVVSPTSFPIMNKPLNAMKNGYKYYFVTSDVVRYTEGSTPLLGSFTYSGPTDSSSDNSPIPTLPSLPASAVAPSTVAPSAVAPSAVDDIVSPTAPVNPAVAPAAQPTATLVTQQTAPTSVEAAISKEKQDKASLLRDIQEIVRTELLQQQKFTTASSQPVLRAGADGNLLMSATPATAQGQELSTARDKFCPKDMNEYIRKDSIPCWNCNIDY